MSQQSEVRRCDKHLCARVSWWRLSLRSQVWLSGRGRCQPASTPAVSDGPARVSLFLDRAKIDPVSQNTHRHWWAALYIKLLQAVILTNSLSPEGGVDADVVRLWEGRCSPPAAGGRRREILLILRLHPCCILFIFHCSRSRLTTDSSLFVLPWSPVPAAVSSSCLSRGRGRRTMGLLLCVLGDTVSWEVIITFGWV